MDSRRSRKLSEHRKGALGRAWRPLVCALVCAGGVGLALSRVSPVYESRVTLALADGPGTSHRDGSLEQRLDSIRSRVLSPDVLYAEASRLASGAPSDASRSTEELVQDLQASIRLSPDDQRKSQFVIAVRRPDPESARALATSISDLLTAEEESTRPAAPTNDGALSARTLELSKQLRGLEDRFPQLMTSGSQGPTRDQSQSSRASTQVSRSEQLNQQLRLESLKDKRFLIQQQISDLDRRIGAQKQLVEQQQKNPQMRDSATYATLVGRRTELQGQRDTLINRQELTDKHPRVVAIDDQISAINRQIEELRRQESGAVRQSPEARELSSLESDRNRLGLELEINGREMARVGAGSSAVRAPEPEARTPERPSSSVINEYLALRQDYAELSARLNSPAAEPAKIAPVEECSLVQAATAPGSSVWPRKWLLLLVSAGAGLMAGAVFSFFLEWRKSGLITGIEDAEFYAKSPILGVVPRATSSRERKRARWVTTARICAVTLVCCLVSVGIAKLLMVTSAIERLGNW